MSQPIKFRMRGRWWSLTHRRMKAHDGLCWHGAKKITIDSSLTGESRMEAYLHELTHAAFPDLKEETVTKTAHDLTIIMYRRLGYRCPTDPT